MAKLDLNDAFRAVPVHPHDRPLLGMQWKGRIFIDTTLRIPLACIQLLRYFSAVADGLLWMIHEQGFTHALHCLDDFLLLGPPESSHCQKALHFTLQLCRDLGVQVVDLKKERPSTTLTFLGTKIDSGNHQLCLPLEKLRPLSPTHSVDATQA